jgi:hypothetical protein
MLFCQPTDLPDVKKPDPLPAAAKVAMERYDKAAAEAKKAYDAAVAKAADAARKELAKIQESETKAGRLETALAVKGQIEKLPDKSDASTDIPKAYLDLADKIASGTLTETEWNSLPGIKVRCEANTVTDTRVVMHKGEAWIVVPHPADKWKTNSTTEPFTYLGVKDPKHPAGPNFMQLQVVVGDVMLKGYLVEDQDGKLTTRCNDDIPTDNLDSIRVKIIRVR